MKKSLIAFIFLIFILISCDNNISEQSNIELSPIWSTIEIDTHQNGIAHSNFPMLVILDNKEFYAIYNEITHSLNYYNIENKSFERKVEFFKSGPDKIQSLGLHSIWRDTIIVREKNKILLFNSSGKLIEELDLKNMCPELDENYSLKGIYGRILNLRRFYTSNNSNKIVLRTYNKENNYEDLYKNPCFCEYDLESKRGEVINIEFPKQLYKKYYGDLENPNIISKGDSIIYNFPFMAAIYIYNKHDGRVEKKEFKADHIAAIVEGARIPRRTDEITAKFLDLRFYLEFGDKYHQIEYDPYRKLYYMAYSKKFIEKMPIEKHLIVFNSRLEKIGEFEIDSKLSSKFVISKKGLLYRNVNDGTFKTLTLHVLNINIVQ